MSRKTYRVKRLERVAGAKEDVTRLWVSWGENEVVSSAGEVLTQAQFDALYPDAKVLNYDDREDGENE